MPLAASTAGESIKAGKEENASEKEVKKGLNNINKEVSQGKDPNSGFRTYNLNENEIKIKSNLESIESGNKNKDKVDYKQLKPNHIENLFFLS